VLVVVASRSTDGASSPAPLQAASANVSVTISKIVVKSLLNMFPPFKSEA
jgi:hypothetical protein